MTPSSFEKPQRPPPMLPRTNALKISPISSLFENMFKTFMLKDNVLTIIFFEKAVTQLRRGHCTCKEMPVIPVNRAVDKKRIIEKNGCPPINVMIINLLKRY
jgi:hypothetical protein